METGKNMTSSNVTTNDNRNQNIKDNFLTDSNRKDILHMLNPLLPKAFSMFKRRKRNSPLNLLVAYIMYDSEEAYCETLIKLFLY